jgi:CRISPR-associated protein Csa3
VRGVPRLNLQGHVSDAEATLLRDLYGLDTPLSISEIANKIDKSKSTIARQVDSLEREYFVKSSKEGRTKMVDVTDSGRVFLKGYDRSQI